MSDIPEKVDKLQLAARIANLYKDLGDDAVPMLADHLEENKALQDDVSTVLADVKTLDDQLAEVQAENKKLKETNTQLMYQQIQQAAPEDDKAEQDDVAKLDAAVQNITL